MIPDWVKTLKADDEFLGFFPLTGLSAFVTIKEVMLHGAFVCSYSEDYQRLGKEATEFWLNLSDYNNGTGSDSWTAYQIS